MKKIKKIIKSVLKLLGYDIDRKRTIERYRDMLKYNFGTIIDIGANVGQFSREMLYAFPNAEIYAFEPIRDCFKRLEKISRKPNFHPYNYALGNNNGETTINVSSYSPSSSLLKMSALHKNIFPHTAGEHKENIQIRKLDDLAKEMKIKMPLLIKIDVQGYEKEVIMGGHETFNKASVIFSETSSMALYEGQPLAEEIKNMLSELGFKYGGYLSQKINPQTGKAVSEDSIFIKS